MLSRTALLLLALASAFPASLGADRELARVEEPPRRIAWHSGDLESALARAASERRLVFVEFSAEWCGWCKRLERDTLAHPEVVRALAGLVSLALDVEEPAGATAAKRYGVSPLPTMVFLDGAGAVVDLLVGYLGPEAFLAELARIERGEGTLPALRRRVAEEPDDLEARFGLVSKLSATRRPEAQAELAELHRRVREGRGFDAAKIDDQARLVKLWRGLKDHAAAERHLEAIRRLDPEGRSFPLREAALAAVRAALDEGYARTGTLDHAPLLAFLAEERHAQLVFDGWMLERYFCAHEAEEARKREQPERRAERQAARRRAEREAWARCPGEQVAKLGHDVAWSWYLEEEHLTGEELLFAVELARAAALAAPASAKHQDTLSRVLLAAGLAEEARAAARRALELEPGNESYREHLAELGR